MSSAPTANLPAEAQPIPQMARMPWYPRDFSSSTRGWSVTAKGVYRELLDAQWDLGDLPKEPEELRLLIAATAFEWKAAWSKVETKFPVDTDGRRRNLRLVEHRRKALDLIFKQRSGAETTNRKRWAK